MKDLVELELPLFLLVVDETSHLVLGDCQRYCLQMTQGGYVVVGLDDDVLGGKAGGGSGSDYHFHLLVFLHLYF